MSVSKLKQESFTITSDTNPYVEAFTSEAFFNRVNIGLARLMSHNTETPFSIFYGKESRELIYTTVNIGAPARETNRYYIASVDQGDLNKKWYKEHETDSRDYGPLALLHMHTSLGTLNYVKLGFSSKDIDVYTIKDLQFGKHMTLYPDRIRGVFVPQTERVVKGNKLIIESLSLLIFGGEGQNTYLQTHEQWYAYSVDKQMGLLRDAGFKSDIIDLPVRNNRVDVDSAKSALIQVLPNNNIDMKLIIPKYFPQPPPPSSSFPLGSIQNQKSAFAYPPKAGYAPQCKTLHRL
jgi:hypothetical protein